MLSVLHRLRPDFPEFSYAELPAGEGFDYVRPLPGFEGHERISNLERAFNVREGLTREDDTLPIRLLEEPLPDEPAQGHVNDIAPLLDRYYDYRGWDRSTGKPSIEKLEEPGLGFVVDDLHGR